MPDPSLRRTQPIRTFHTPKDIEAIGGADKARNIAEAAINGAIKKAKKALPVIICAMLLSGWVSRSECGTSDFQAFTPKKREVKADSVTVKTVK